MSDDEYEPGCDTRALKTAPTADELSDGDMDWMVPADVSCSLTKAKLPFRSAEVSATKSHEVFAILWGQHASEALTAHRRPVRCVAVNRSGTTVVTGGADGVLSWYELTAPRATDAPRGAPTRKLQPFSNRVQGFQPLAAADWTPDGKLLFLAQDGPTALLVRSDGKQLEECPRGLRHSADALATKGHTGNVSAVAVGNAGTQLCTGASDGTARLWDPTRLADGAVGGIRHGPTGKVGDVVAAIKDVSFPAAALANIGAASDSLGVNVLLTAADDGFVQLWDVRQQFRPGCGVRVGDALTAVAAGVRLDSWQTAKVSGTVPAVGVSPVPGSSSAHHVAVRRANGTIRCHDVRKPTEAVWTLSGLPCETGGAAGMVRPGAMPLGPTTALGMVLATDGTAVFHNAAPGGHVVFITADGASAAVKVAVRVSDSSIAVTAFAFDSTSKQCFVGASDGSVVALHHSSSPVASWSKGVVGERGKRARADSDSD